MVTQIDVLDPKQLRIIEKTHRGFLYQHLFAVACLLKASFSSRTTIFVERDEDSEVVRDEDHLYIQVKTRSQPLIQSDIDTALERFDGIRREHVAQRRLGTPHFYIIANTEPSDTLAKAVQAWPKDVHLITPQSSAHLPDYLPPAWRTLEEALAWCTALADQIPFKSLSSETLVWKLAAIVQHASTGSEPRREHEFRSDELSNLFEQIVTELHRLPDAPTPYRTQEDELDFSNDQPVRLIVGLSGAGKTAWASQGSLHESGHVVYFDGGDMPRGSLAPALARELAARLASITAVDIKRVFLPGSTGLQSLRALHTLIGSSSLDVVLAIDNVQRLEATDLIGVVQTIPSTRWVLLGQPWPDKGLIETRLSLKSEELGGWGIETISQVFTNHNCSADPPLLERVRRLTGGLPLFVEDAARLTESHYARNAEEFTNAMESLTHPEVSGQQIILGEVYKRISAPAAAAMSILVVADVPISADEAAAMMESGICAAKEDAYSIIRELVSWGIIQLLRDQRLILHDAFRTTARDGQRKVRPEQVTAAKKRLADLLTKTLSATETDRLRLYCRLLPDIGETDTLIDLSSSLSEFFREYGFSEEFTKILSEILESETLGMEDRFWAADTLVFWALGTGDLVHVDSWLDTMEECLPHIANNETEQFALLMKKMLLAGVRGRPIQVHKCYSQARQVPSMTPAKLRILEYNYANTLFKLEDYDAAEKILYALIAEYYKVLGIRIPDVLFKQAAQIVPKLAPQSSVDDAKHLADTLDLTAQVLNAQNKPSGFCRIHACKFFGIADAISSAVRVGQDFVDESLARNDLLSAREMFENMLLPLLRERKMLGRWVDVHAQYAVVLAYDGEVEQARTLMKSLEPMIGSDTDLSAQLAHQREIIEAIASGNVVLRSSQKAEEHEVLQNTSASTSSRKIGRNERCPCGSGMKYKKCCGR